MTGQLPNRASGDGAQPVSPAAADLERRDRRPRDPAARRQSRPRLPGVGQQPGDTRATCRSSRATGPRRSAPPASLACWPPPRGSTWPRRRPCSSIVQSGAAAQVLQGLDSALAKAQQLARRSRRSVALLEQLAGWNRVVDGGEAAGRLPSVRGSRCGGARLPTSCRPMSSSASTSGPAPNGRPASTAIVERPQRAVVGRHRHGRAPRVPRRHLPAGGR